MAYLFIVKKEKVTLYPKISVLRTLLPIKILFLSITQKLLLKI